MENKVFNRILGNDEIAEYTKEVSNKMSQDRLEEIYNKYYSGDAEDFKGSFKTVNEVAQFLNYIIEMGTSPGEVHQMVRVLS